MGQNKLTPWSWQINVPLLRGRMVDLTLGIYDGAPTYPGSPECSVVTTRTLELDQLNMTKLTIGTHGTTHLDAPAHFLPDGKTVDALDLSKCIGPARVIDLTHKGVNEAVVVADLEPYAGSIVPGARIVLRFGWDRVYPHARYFTDHPYLTMDAIKWFALRRISMLGMDLPTPNPTDWIEAHITLLRAEIVIVEGLAHLDRLPVDAFFFIAAPLLILGCDGAPIRALGLI